MELMKAIEKRRTVRDFSSKEVPFEITKKALEAGLKAPTHNHLRQWDFILVRNMEKRRAITQTETMLESVNKEIEESFEGYEKVASDMYLEAIPKQKRMIMTAPELLVMVYKPKTPIAESKRVYDLNCLASIWCCIENILLSLAENDVFGVTFIPQNTPAVKTILDIPLELEVAAIIPFGYKAENAKEILQKDVNLEAKLHIDSWKKTI
jgi:nitroreductase